jgi:Uncharacterised nucleotidyltransferase
MEPRTRDFYRRVMERLRAEGIPFMVGGAYALQQYTGICRETKDVDLFVRPADRDRVLAALDAAGYETEVTSPIWIGKARCGDDFVDVIFSSGNAMAEVDDAWFEHDADGEVLGVPVRLCPPEEMIWSKAYIMERERYDGADIAHLVRACGRTMDWKRLLARFGAHWRVLLSHLVLFGFVYPAERDVVPAWLMRELLARLDAELDAARADEPACQGTLLSRYQYRIDIEEWGYRDGRVRPTGRMTSGQAKAMDREPREA